MNKDIIKELQKCKIATIPDNLEDIETFVIDKLSDQSLEINQCYKLKVKLEDQSDLINNWGNKVFPNISNIDVEVIDIKGKYIKVFSPIWDGWLPKANIQIISKL